MFARFYWTKYIPMIHCFCLLSIQKQNIICRQKAVGRQASIKINTLCCMQFTQATSIKQTLSKKILVLIAATHFLPSTGLKKNKKNIYMVLRKWPLLWLLYFQLSALEESREEHHQTIRTVGATTCSTEWIRVWWQEPTFEGIFTLIAQTAT